MRWYLFVAMLTFFSTAAPMQLASPAVPSLEYDQNSIEDMDELFMRVSQPSLPKTPRWQLILQQWTVSFVAQLLQVKEYVNGQYEKMKMVMYAMLYRNNLVAKK